MTVTRSTTHLRRECTSRLVTTALLSLAAVVSEGWVATTEPAHLVAVRAPSPSPLCFRRSPVVVVSATATALASSSHPADHDDSFRWRSTKMVVLVDGEESVRRSVGRFLFDRGYQVKACPDADTAWRNVHVDDAPHAVVTEIDLGGRESPNDDGLALLGRIRAHPDLASIPVVLLTSRDAAEDRVAGYRAGADVHVPKPFDPEELLAVVDGVLRRHSVLNGDDVGVDDLLRELNDVRRLLSEEGGAGVGNGWLLREGVTRRDGDDNGNGNGGGGRIFLNPAERDVLESLCQGRTNREIAEEIFTSRRRVEQHLTSMFRKTGTSNRTELVRWAVRTGLVEI